MADGALALEELGATFASWGLEVPRIPEQMVPHLSRTGVDVWSSRPDVTDLTPILYFLEESATTDVADYVAVGHGGRGAASQGLHYYLVCGPTRVFVQVGWSNVYADPGDERRHAIEIFSQVAPLLNAASSAANSGWFRPGERLLIATADFDFSGWCLLPGRVSRAAMMEAPWHDEGAPLEMAKAALSHPRSGV